MLDFIYRHKWKAAGLLFLIQVGLAYDFFKRASFGVMVDGAILLGSVLLVLGLVLYLCSWVFWYVWEVARKRERKGGAGRWVGLEK